LKVWILRIIFTASIAFFIITAGSMFILPLAEASISQCNDEPYIESTGMSAAPKWAKGAQARALARRGAIVDLQRNLLAHAAMGYFMENRVSGNIRNVELLDETWDGKSYTVTGRVRASQLSVVTDTYFMCQFCNYHH